MGIESGPTFTQTSAIAGAIKMALSKLEGIIVPLVTPFAPDESFDASAMAKLIEFVLAQGADALMTTAVTGEGMSLSVEETLSVWDAVFKVSDGRCPVIPAIITTTTRDALCLVRAAERMGAVAVMAAPILPELYAGRSHDDVYAFYAEIAAATPLTIILFNYPSLTGVDLVASILRRLSEIKVIRYIKESTGDIRRVHNIHRLPGRPLEVICGAPNVALESFALGCKAWITGIINVVPRSAKQLIQAACSLLDFELARHIYYNQILPTVDLISSNNKPTATIKAGVTARGIRTGLARRPSSDISNSDQEFLREVLEKILEYESKTDAIIADRLSQREITSTRSS